MIYQYKNDDESMNVAAMAVTVFLSWRSDEETYNT